MAAIPGLRPDPHVDAAIAFLAAIGSDDEPTAAALLAGPAPDRVCAWARDRLGISAADCRWLDHPVTAWAALDHSRSGRTRDGGAYLVFRLPSGATARLGVRATPQGLRVDPGLELGLLKGIRARLARG